VQRNPASHHLINEASDYCNTPVVRRTVGKN